MVARRRHGTARLREPSSAHLSVSSQAVPNTSTRSMSVGSPSGARKLFTRFGTGHICRTSLRADLSSSVPALPLSHGSKSLDCNKTGIRSCMLATNSLTWVIITVQDFNSSPDNFASAPIFVRCYSKGRRKRVNFDCLLCASTRLSRHSEMRSPTEATSLA